MKRKTKRLLGAFGLAVVMAMTAIAYALPTPEAHAEEDLTGNKDITIQVTVVGSSSVTLMKPVPGEDNVMKSNLVPVEYTYQKMTKVVTRLVCPPESVAAERGAVVVDEVVDEYVPETEEAIISGKRAFTIDLNNYGVSEDMVCQVILSGKDIDDKDLPTPIGAQFEYRSVKVDMGDKDNENGKPTTDDKGDPKVTIGVNENVYSLLLQVYDPNGDPVFVKDGKEEPILVSRDEFDGDSYTLYLPMAKYGAKTGWYELVAIAYGADGKEVVSMNVYRFYYGPDTPNVPGTGAIMDNLNISRADYVATGLIAFGAVAVFGIYLVARKSRR